MTDHVALPVTVPDLSGLTDEQLTALRTKCSSAARDYRRKANSAITKLPDLKKAWNRMLSMNGATPPEERREIMSAFEQALLPHPSIYVDHAMANALILFDSTCREESLRRSPAGLANKRRG